MTHKLGAKWEQVNHNVHDDDDDITKGYFMIMQQLTADNRLQTAIIEATNHSKDLLQVAEESTSKKILHTRFFFDWTFIRTIPPLPLQAGEKIVLMQTQNGQSKVIHVWIISLEGECKSFRRA